MSFNSFINLIQIQQYDIILKKLFQIFCEFVDKINNSFYFQKLITYQQLMRDQFIWKEYMEKNQAQLKKLQ